MTNQLDNIINIAKDAGQAILEVYESADFGVETKADDSPLTRADLAAHKIIVAGLSELDPSTPILSEEGQLPEFAERQKWSRYYIVDPLDGTKEFINRNGEFTVNIALVENGVPVLGVVYVPVQDVTYAGQQLQNKQAFIEQDGKRSDIGSRSMAKQLRDKQPVTVVASRRHGGEALELCLNVLNETFANVELTSMGSSLKLCLVAAGQADLYPRLAPTSEWDTAAAQAVVEAAGGVVVDTSLMPLRYNGKESILNPHFYVIGDPEFTWNDILSTVPTT